MILLITARILLFCLDAAIDAYLADAKHKYIDHTKHAFFAALFHALLTIFGEWSGLPQWWLLFELILIPSARWIIHDLFMNYLRGLSWWYVGEGSALDRRFGGNIWIKIGFLAGSVGVAWVVVELV